MLGKLLKYDLKRCFSWFWILSLVTFGCAGLTRLINLGNGPFWTVISGLFSGITIGLVVNVVLQPFIRIFVGFQKDCYADESYLTHTLPVTKNQILFSKLLSALIQMIVAFIVFAVSLFILYWTPEIGEVLGIMANMIIAELAPNTNVSSGVIIFMLVVLVVIAVIAVMATGFSAIIITNEKAKSKKTLIAILFTLILVYAQNFVCGLLALCAALIFGADISAEFMPPEALLAFALTYIIINIIYVIMHVLISKWQFNKGVNID